MQDERVLLFSEFYRFLRIEKGFKVKDIMAATGLTRVTLLDIEKQKRQTIL